MHRPIAMCIASCMLVTSVLACRSAADKRISNMNSPAPVPSPMLKKGDRVRIFGHTGTIINFIPRGVGDDSLAAVVRTDEEITFESVRGNIVIMQLRYLGARWGGGSDIDRIVSGNLCPSGSEYADVPSWYKYATCVEIDPRLIYEVL
jgi:hypothetical protein